MWVISVLNSKGGSGKTTIASNLAHSLHLSGNKVLLVDSDPQGSLRDWNEANGGEVLPVVGLDRETLPKDLKAIQGDYDVAVIDGAPAVAKLAGAAVKASDLVIIPVQPSPYDVWACSALVEVIKARQEVTDGVPLAAFVISRAIKNTKLSGEIEKALLEYELPVLKNGTTQKVAYPTSAAEGKTVMMEPRSPAACEIEAIRIEVEKMIDGIES